MKVKKLTPAEKVAFYKENGYWFGATPKATISVNTNEINIAEVLVNVEDVKMMSASERVAIEEANIAMRAKARKNNL